MNYIILPENELREVVEGKRMKRMYICGIERIIEGEVEICPLILSSGIETARIVVYRWFIGLIIHSFQDYTLTFLDSQHLRANWVLLGFFSFEV